MMTLEEIGNANINLEVAREAYAQTEKRLEDTLATKASHEQKAFTLMAAYTSLAIALFAASGLLAVNAAHALTPAFCVSGLLYAIGSAVSFGALWEQTYGALGSAPCIWLRPSVIDGDSKALPANLAYVAFFHQARIDAGVASNRYKAKIVCAVIAIGILATFILGVWSSVVLVSAP